METFGRRFRQEGAIKRTEAQLAIYEQNVKDAKEGTDNKVLKKKIERAKITIENTKENMK
jgi:hypothetical protein